MYLAKTSGSSWCVRTLLKHNITINLLVQLDVRKKGQEILDILCKTFILGYCDEYCLSLPRTRKQEKTEVLLSQNC